LAIRVLATIPDLDPPVKTVDPAAALGVASKGRAATTLEARVHQPPPSPRGKRRRRRAIFPSGSITVLAVIALAIWSYVAVREMRRPEHGTTETRLAAEANATGTTIR
jgi:hypothetical protein